MRRIAAFMLVLLLVAGGASAAPASLSVQGGTFLDDDGNVHEANIEAVAKAEITKGCNPPANDWYCPSDPVTRGQMAAFLRRAFDLPAASRDYFDDDTGSVFEADINALAEAGITRGCNPPQDNLFCPGNSVTRGQMAAFLRRAFDYAPVGEDYFADDSGSVFEADINAIAAVGVTRGCNPPYNTDYCPNDEVRRDQMASFLARALGLTTGGISTGWLACDFEPFTISGTGGSIPALRVPGDRPAILDITHTGTGVFWVDWLDQNRDSVNPLLFDDGGGYQGVRPVNQHYLFDPIHYLAIVEASGAWTVEVRPICTARTMTGDTISGETDDVILLTRRGNATLTHTGNRYFTVWAHSDYETMALLASTPSPIDRQVTIPYGTVFLDIWSEGDAWSVSFP